MTPLWHDLLHDATAAIFLLTGIPFLFLASRASARRPRRAPLLAAGAARGPIFATITALLACAALTLGAYAARASAVDAAVLSMAAAALGGIALRTVRSARFDSIVTIPLVGLIGIAALLAIAGPQRTIDHHAHTDTSAIQR